MKTTSAEMSAVANTYTQVKANIRGALVLCKVIRKDSTTGLNPAVRFGRAAREELFRSVGFVKGTGLGTQRLTAAEKVVRLLICSVNSAGRVPALQAGCRRFEPVTEYTPSSIKARK